MIELFKSALTFLIPPKSLSGAEGHRWASTIATGVIIIGVIQMLQILLIWGWVPSVFLGFPTQDYIANQLMQSEQKVEQHFTTSNNSLELLIVEQRLQDVRERQCRAIKDNNHDASEAQGNILETLRTRYFMLAMVPYDVRPCTEY